MPEQQPIRVLFLEDRPERPGLLPELLGKVKGAPFKLTQVELNDATVKRVAAERYDVTLLHFGIMDDESLDIIKTLYGRVEWRPIVVVSDQDQDEMVIRSVRMGADDFIKGSELDTRLLARALLFAIERTTRARKRAGVPAYREIRQSAGGIMDRLPMGVILVTADSRVLLINRKAREIAGKKDGFGVDGQGLLRASKASETKALINLIARTAEANGETEMDNEFTMALSRPSLKQPLLLLISPVGGDDQSGDRPGGAAIFISDPEDSLEISSDVLARLYDLTTAEIRVLKVLCQGKRIEALAEELGITVHTVRHQLKQIFRKTDTQRQSELIKLILTGPAAIRAERRGPDVKAATGS